MAPRSRITPEPLQGEEIGTAARLQRGDDRQARLERRPPAGWGVLALTPAHHDHDDRDAADSH